MDGEQRVRMMAEAKCRGRITTLDVFAADRKDMASVAGLLPHTDCDDLRFQCTVMTWAKWRM